MSNFLSFVLLLSLFLSISISSCASITGYDIDITYGSLEEAKEAVLRYDIPGGSFHVTGVSNTTVSLYTSLKEEADRLLKRSSSTIIRVR
jgi:hypothetical protein